MIFNNKMMHESNNLKSNEDNLINEDEIKTDPFIAELKKYEEPASDFKGFSVDNSEDNIVEEPKAVKRYTKAKSEVVEEEKDAIIPNNSNETEEDFLSQMEANLIKSEEERKSKKATSKKSNTTKKSTTTKSTTTKKTPGRKKKTE